MKDLPKSIPDNVLRNLASMPEEKQQQVVDYYRKNDVEEMSVNTPPPPKQVAQPAPKPVASNPGLLSEYIRRPDVAPNIPENPVTADGYSKELLDKTMFNMPSDPLLADPAVNLMFNDIGVDEEMLPNIKEFMNGVAMIESDGNPEASNKISSAKGKYQWLNGELPSGKSGLNAFKEDLDAAELYYGKADAEVPKWVTDAKVHNDPRKLKSDEQDKLFLFRMYRLAKNADLLEAFKGDKKKQRQLYFDKHHTDPDLITKARTYRYI